MSQDTDQISPRALRPGLAVVIAVLCVATPGAVPDAASAATQQVAHTARQLLQRAIHLEEAVGGGPRIIRDGGVSIENQREGLGREFALERHPRTAVGHSRDGRAVFLVTVDGHQPGYSVGMSLEELARFMASQLASFSHTRVNAHQAVNLDGGKSTTMVVREQVVNRPSYPTGEQPVANALTVVAPPVPADDAAL